MMRRYIQGLLIIFTAFITTYSYAADTACSKVSMEIIQELTLERIAFDAKLVISNKIPDKDLTKVRVDVMLTDANGNIMNDLFFIKLSSTQNIDSVTGDGIVQANTAAEVHWLIIPSPGTGGDNERGVYYWAGATLTYSVGETNEVVPIAPDRILIKPQPLLVLDYFMPYEVLGDNPFTPEKVEAPVPFPLALRILNDGYGMGKNLKIESAQPKIVDNKQGLLVDFQILGSQVNDTPVTPTLTAAIGDLQGKKASTASWDMIATLSGRFIEFGAEFTHASELGGELTSLIQETNAHYLVHMVRVNRPYSDNYLDFLADSDRDADHLPDTIFESEIPNGSTDRVDSVSPVYTVSATNTPARPTNDNPKVELKTSNPVDAGWTYVRTSDPSRGMLALIDVVRKDGTHLDPHNFWVDKKLDEDYKEIFMLQLLDYRESNVIDGTYMLVYEQPDEDITPPVTALIYDGYAYAGDAVVIPPATRIVFTASDNDGGSGVDYMMKKLNGTDSDFVPAVPFNFSSAGSYAVDYYSVDAAGNTEEIKSTTIVVDDSPPVISSFTANPAVIIPHAPEGIAAARSLNLNITASDNVSNLPLTIEIAAGESFSADAVVRTIEGELSDNTAGDFIWYGKEDGGMLAATGKYTARVTVRDGLGNDADVNHQSQVTVSLEVAEWFSGDRVSFGDGEEKYPSISGTRVVWQDQRAGNWDIYFRDLPDGTETVVTSNISDQIYPDVDGGRIVWQDSRTDGGDIYGYDIATGSEFAVSTDTGNQERPAINGDWVVWQDNGAGNWDIFAYNLSTMEKIQITNHERDQMNPTIEGTTILWQDYRHGLGEIYSYDLLSRTETRLTTNIDNQTDPVLSGNIYLWTDHRNGGRDIYLKQANGERRLTYGAGDQAGADINGGTIVYTDYEKGLNDPNLAFYDIATGLGGILNANPAKQEEPAIGAGYVVWQDNRGGTYRIYMAELEVVAVPLDVTVRPGFNLIAVGESLTSQYPTVSALISAYGVELGIEKVMALDALHGTYSVFEYDGAGTSGEDFALRAGMAIVLYTATEGAINVAETGEVATYRLLTGTNEIGILSIPIGYRAYDLLESVGLDKIQSVRRFNGITGRWETAAVKRDSGAVAPVGVNFDISPGEGLVITMIERIDGWKP